MALHPQIVFILMHMTAVMLLAIIGNLFLIFIIFRANATVKRRISPVQQYIYKAEYTRKSKI
ncbi:unnamed protein product [Gongylonema pulchrum]|uniref:G_PROTEIN_RECEP_F1_2 domain-containing protein n=1 Tax=Gongylonema pulchrum TaxID=637853 RepID=A0A183EJA7_9BILA|nr:unnamed protein product [Gongylonema pulchrum]